MLRSCSLGTATAPRFASRGIPHQRWSGVRTRLYPLSTAGDGAAPVTVGPYHILLTASACALLRQAALLFVPPADVQSRDGSVDASYVQLTKSLSLLK